MKKITSKNAVQIFQESLEMAFEDYLKSAMAKKKKVNKGKLPIVYCRLSTEEDISKQESVNMVRINREKLFNK